MYQINIWYSAIRFFRQTNFVYGSTASCLLPSASKLVHNESKQHWMLRVDVTLAQCVCVCVCSMITQFISAVITQPVRKRSAKWYRLIDHDEKRQEEERKNCKDVYHTYTFWVLSYTKFAPFKVESVNFLYHTHTPYEVTCLFLHHATPDVLLHQYGISYPWRVYVHADSFNGTFCGCNCKPTWTLSGENKNTLFTFSP